MAAPLFVKCGSNCDIYPTKSVFLLLSASKKCAIAVAEISDGTSHLYEGGIEGGFELEGDRIRNRDTGSIQVGCVGRDGRPTISGEM